MITVYTLFPEVLNLNGDAANTLVLQKNLLWLGQSVQIEVVSNQEQLLALTRAVSGRQPGVFVTIGHGSLAGMKSLAKFDGLIRELIESMIASKTPGIVVGSALTWAGVELSAKGERVSEFVVAEVEAEGWPVTALGYLNSDLAIKPVTVEANLILTLLHGPFLVKNPSWLNRIIEILGSKAEPNDKQDLAEQYVEEIWRLEANH